MHNWTPASPALPLLDRTLLSPIDVLFHYDEPLIFTSKYMFLDVLCYKYAEVGDDEVEASLFLGSIVNETVIESLKAGRLSIRGALNSPTCFVFQVDAEGVVEKVWTCAFDRLPEKILPKNNVGINSSFGLVPDQLSIIHGEKPFMSINFLGGSLNAGQISLLTLRSIIDNTYSLFRSLAIETLARNSDERTTLGQLEKMLLIPVRQPQLASLRLDFDRPKIDINQKKSRRTIDIGLIDAGILKKRDDFFSALTNISRETRDKNVSSSYARENFETLDALIHLMPTADTAFKIVEFDVNISSTENVSVKIEEEQGQKIADAYKIALRSLVELKGKVVEINFRSASFVIETSDKREVTCMVPYNWDRPMPLKAGEEISVGGRLIRRKRRDLLLIRQTT